MERLTFIDHLGWYVNGPNQERLRGPHINSLAFYENTGIEPNEIEQQLMNFSSFLSEMTHGHMSKTNYTVEAMVSEANDCFERVCDECADREELFDFKKLGSIDHLRDLVQAEKDGKDAQELYRAALDTWGADAQTVMVFEEMSELQKELCKHARGKDNRESIADEIADVWIMLEQMMLLHDCRRIVMEHKKAKLKRLAGRLNCAESPKTQLTGENSTEKGGKGHA